MSGELTPDDLAALGLETSALGEIETLAYPQPRVDDARGRPAGGPGGPRAALGSSASRPGATPVPGALQPPLDPRGPSEGAELDLLAVRSEALEDIGLSAALAPDLSELHLWGDHDTTFVIVTGGETSDERLAGAEASGGASLDVPVTRVRLPLRQTFRFVIAAPDRSALALVQHRREDLRVQPVYPWADPPIDAWDQADDTTLNAMTQKRAMQADRWERTLVAGMVARLVEPPPGTARARLQGLMSGTDSGAQSATGGPAVPAGPRSWFRQLSAGHRALVARRAVGRGQVLAADLGDCRDALVPTNQRLASTWRDLCHRRDDLEGVRVLLRSADAREVEALEAVLRDVDALGKAVRFSWPPEIEVDDERLRRVALSDPGAWWGSTVYPVQLL